MTGAGATRACGCGGVFSTSSSTNSTSPVCKSQPSVVVGNAALAWLMNSSSEASTDSSCLLSAGPGEVGPSSAVESATTSSLDIGGRVDSGYTVISTCCEMVGHSLPTATSSEKLFS